MECSRETRAAWRVLLPSGKGANGPQGGESPGAQHPAAWRASPLLKQKKPTLVPDSEAFNSYICVGCDIVQADHAPDGGVAQGIFHGILVRHHGRNQEEVEEGLGQEVKGQEEENAQTTTCTCMDEMK